jgi:hypothetical protein
LQTNVCSSIAQKRKKGDTPCLFAKKFEKNTKSDADKQTKKIKTFFSEDTAVLELFGLRIIRFAQVSFRSLVMKTYTLLQR